VQGITALEHLHVLPFLKLPSFVTVKYLFVFKDYKCVNNTRLVLSKFKRIASFGIFSQVRNLIQISQTRQIRVFTRSFISKMSETRKHTSPGDQDIPLDHLICTQPGETPLECLTYIKDPET
jgi:hypothetical protein